MTNKSSLRPSDLVAARIRELRRQRRWSAKDLSGRCAATGSAEVTASVIANIETGRRDSDGRRRRDISVEELVVFARAFGVHMEALLPMADLEAAAIAAAAQDDTFTELLLRALSRGEVREALNSALGDKGEK